MRFDALRQQSRALQTQSRAELETVDEIEVLTQWLEAKNRGVVIKSAPTFRTELGWYVQQVVERAVAEYIEDEIERLERKERL